MNKALVILSGGQDSVTSLFWALGSAQQVEAITFYYGQNHSVEIDCARAVCMANNVKQKFVDISFLPQLVNSALTSNGDVNVLNEKGLPSSFVPNRNALFITLAHAYAQKIGADTLITGVCQTDYSGYPDCRLEFISILEKALNNGSMSSISIATPLMFLTKAETFKLAEKLGRLEDVVEHSHTCYLGHRGAANRHFWGYGCGECPACNLREKGYVEFLKEKK